MVDRPYHGIVRGPMWLAIPTRPDVANAVQAFVNHSHDPCERYCDEVIQVLKYPKKTKNFHLTFRKGRDRLALHCDAECVKKERGMRSVSGFAVMFGGMVVPATSRTHHSVPLSTAEAEYVAMPEEAKEGLLVNAVWT